MMEVVRYEFRSGSRLSQAKAQIVGARLRKLAGENEVLTAQVVVDDARKSVSPLHDFFEWNDKRAAEEYRLEQARHLIRSIEVVYENRGGKELPSCRQFQNLWDADRDAPYIGTRRVLSDADLRAELLRSALQEAEGWRVRYENLAELAEVFTAIGRVQRKAKRRTATKSRKTKRGKTRAA